MHNLIRHYPEFKLLKPSEFALNSSRNSLSYAQHFNNSPKGDRFSWALVGMLWGMYASFPSTITCFRRPGHFSALQFHAQQVSFASLASFDAF